MPNKTLTIKYIATHLSAIIGIVCIWRGVWYVLDEVDKWLFSGSHIWTALLGIGLGLLILYIPDKDLKEIEGGHH
jgi:hypothetical protein